MKTYLIPMFLGRETTTDIYEIVTYMADILAGKVDSGTDTFEVQFPGVVAAVNEAHENLSQQVPKFDKRRTAWGSVPTEGQRLEMLDGKVQLFWHEYKSDRFPINAASQKHEDKGVRSE